MRQRSIIGASKTGSISRTKARSAAKSSANSGRHRSKTIKQLVAAGASLDRISERVREQYLGHFGFEPVLSPSSRGSAKTSAKKAGARKLAKKSASKKAGARKSARSTSKK